MAQLTQALKKQVASLATPKGRHRMSMFAAEGTKCVLDTFNAFNVRYLLATRAWLDSWPEIRAGEVIEVTRADLRSMSTLTLAPDVIAVYDLPHKPHFDPAAISRQLVVALDRVQDPGNLGTIMRTADWMGITTILASTDTVDCFNPKAVQATMGAISRVKVIYGDLASMLATIGSDICGTFLDGENIYTAALPEVGVVVMGNEGSGISPQVAATVNRRLLIPSYPPERPTGESLNVATATAIVLSQFISRHYGKN